MGSRRIVACVLATGLAILGMPAAAQAAGSIVVVSAGSPASSVGSLAIELEATTPVVPGSLEAELFAPGASTPALTVTSFTLTSGTNAGAGTTVWTVTAPITQLQLPLNTYSITVSAADTGGDTVDEADAGTLAYVIQPTVTLSASPGTVSYGQDITLSGTDTGLYPDGSTHAVAGQQIDYLGADPTTTTTDANGNFSFSLQAGIGAGEYLANGVKVKAVADTTTAAVFSDVAPVTAERDPIRVTATFQPAVQAYGSTVSLTGNVSYESGTTWLPLVNDAVYANVIGCPYSDPCRQVPPDYSGTTDALTGDFSIPMQVQLPYQYSVDAAYPGFSGDWFTESPITVSESVNHIPLTVTFTAQRNIHGKINLTSCEAIAGAYNEPVYNPHPVPLPSMQIQYGGAPAGPWTTIATSNPGANGCFGVDVKPRRGDMFYREVAGSSVAYNGATSTAVRAAATIRTAIRHFTASHREVRPGQRVRLGGDLILTPKVSMPVKIYKVQILFQPGGSSRWMVVATVYANPPQYEFWATVVMHESGRFEARCTGNSYTFPSRTGPVSVRVS